MGHLTRTRVAAAAVAAALMAVVLPGVALAAPANDDFDHATAITALPSTTTTDTTGATEAPDDPRRICGGYHVTRTVWLRYTPTDDALVKLSRLADDKYNTFFVVFTGTRGALTPLPNACSAPFPAEKVFHVKAGTTYHVMVAEQELGLPGPSTLSLVPLSHAPNDDRANAAPLALPSQVQGDLGRASAEPGEAPPSCRPEATQSLWYRYTATRTHWVNVDVSFKAVSVHRADLSEVDCVPGGYGGSVFAAVEGETYLIRVADTEQNAGPVTFDLREADPIKPSAWSYPYNPSVFDDVTFDVGAGDRHGKPLVRAVIDFGDGTTQNYVPGQEVRHRYTRDGVFPVTVTGSTADGRTGTGGTRLVTVDTHDVSVAGLSVPTSARAGQTKSLEVSLVNRQQAEDVRVTLHRVDESGQEQQIGQAVQRVEASPTGEVDLPFAYTYTAQDAALGKVAFRAVVTLENPDVREARPGDNEARATTTSVRPAAVGKALTD
ncbi:PKD domain-containing protein [Lentzea sp. JNUCC 0626]|uniref:PKD domain-containing protein n=1 Tax=Lentzea sp. JNUCC 0626 TaxID=3367513 RepID=UPI0037484312